MDRSDKLVTGFPPRAYKVARSKLLVSIPELIKTIIDTTPLLQLTVYLILSIIFSRVYPG